MERGLAGDGVEISSLCVARLETATTEKKAEAERRAQILGREEVHEHYEPDEGETLNEDSDVMTPLDEADDELVEVSPPFDQLKDAFDDLEVNRANM